MVGEAQTKHDELVASAQRATTSSGPASATTSCSTPAQQRHDELLAEATTRHDTMIREARDQSTGMVDEAQQQKQAILGELGQERDLLQKKIAELRSFERNYRARLKSYLESQLQRPRSRPAVTRAGAPRPPRRPRGTSRATPRRAEARLVPPRRAPTGAGRRPACARCWGAGTTARCRTTARRAVRRSGCGPPASRRGGGARAGRTTYVVAPLSRTADGSILATCPRFRG